MATDTLAPPKPARWRPAQVAATEVRKPPRPGSELLVHARLINDSTSEASTINSEAVGLILRRLINAPSKSINVLRQQLRMVLTPENLLDGALSEYRRTGRQDYLTFASSLLEDCGSLAWPTLRRFARSGAPECERFVRLIATCPGVPERERIRALCDLARNPDRYVRSQLFEHLAAFPREDRRAVLSILATDSDVAIRDEAGEHLGYLAD